MCGFENVKRCRLRFCKILCGVSSPRATVICPAETPLSTSTAAVRAAEAGASGPPAPAAAAAGQRRASSYSRSTAGPASQVRPGRKQHRHPPLHLLRVGDSSRKRRTPPQLIARVSRRRAHPADVTVSQRQLVTVAQLAESWSPPRQRALPRRGSACMTARARSAAARRRGSVDTAPHDLLQLFP